MKGLVFSSFRLLLLLGMLLPLFTQAQVADTLKNSTAATLQKDSLPRKNEKTILNQKQKKNDNSLDYKLNYAGHHLHRAGRNAIAVGGILSASVAAVILLEMVFKSTNPDDNIPKYTLYGGLGLGFMICSTKGGYHLVKAGKSLKDARFFNRDKTIYDL